MANPLAGGSGAFIHEEGPWTTAWHPLITSRPPFKDHFEPDGRPAPQLLNEMTDRAVAMILEGKPGRAVRLLQRWQSQLGVPREDLDLSAYAREITELARTELLPGAAIPFPDPDMPLERYAFEAGISRNPDDLVLLALYAQGGLNLESLRADWPARDAVVPFLEFFDNLQRSAYREHVLELSATFDDPIATGSVQLGGGMMAGAVANILSQSGAGGDRWVYGQSWMLHLATLAPELFDDEAQRLARVASLLPGADNGLDGRALAELRAREPQLLSIALDRIRETFDRSCAARPDPDALLDCLAARLGNPPLAAQRLHDALLSSFVDQRRLAEAAGAPDPAAAARKRLSVAFEAIGRIDPSVGQLALDRVLDLACDGVIDRAHLRGFTPAERFVLLSVAGREWRRLAEQYSRGGRKEVGIIFERGPARELCFDDGTLDESSDFYPSRELGRRGAQEEAHLREFAFSRSREPDRFDPEAAREQLRDLQERLPPTRLQTGWLRMTASSDSPGRQISQIRSPEQVGNRAYQPGDDAAGLDWRAMARSDSILVKQYAATTPESARRIDLLVDAEALLSGQGEPNRNILKIAELVSSAHAQRKDVGIGVYFRGTRLWEMSSLDVKRDLQPAPPKLPGERLLATLWTIGRDAADVIARYDFGLRSAGCDMTRHSGPPAAGPERRSTPLTILACAPQNTAQSLAALPRGRGEVRLLRCEDFRGVDLD